MTRSPMFSVWSVLLLLIAALRAGAEEAAKLPEYDIPEIPTHWKATAPAGHDAQPVTDAMLRASGGDASSWLQYHGDYRGYRHSPLATLTPATAKNLQLAWVMPTGTVGQMEASPLVYDGVLYVTTSFNRLFALDAESGRVLWRYDHPQPADLRLCCGPPSRGVAIAGDLVLMATLDAKLLAFDRRTGELRWSQEVAPYQDGFSFDGRAARGGRPRDPRAWRRRVRRPRLHRRLRRRDGRARLAALHRAREGRAGRRDVGGRLVRDRRRAHVDDRRVRRRDRHALLDHRQSVARLERRPAQGRQPLRGLAARASIRTTGARKWYFQFTPHDVWDYDGNTQLFLVDVPFGGKTVKAAAQPNRNGYFYRIDRSDGRFLRATPYVEQVNWGTIDAQGRPVVDPKKMPRRSPASACARGTWAGSTARGRPRTTPRWASRSCRRSRAASSS